MKIATQLQHRLRKKIKHWQTYQALAKLDNRSLKDIGVNHWELTYKRRFSKGEQA